MARLTHALDETMERFMENLEAVRQDNDPQMTPEEFRDHLAAYWDQGLTVDGWFTRWFDLPASTTSNPTTP